MVVGQDWDFLSPEIAEILRVRGRLYLPVLEGAQGPEPVIDGRRVINLASNNYLGLSFHPQMIAAAVAATEEFGVGGDEPETH